MELVTGGDGRNLVAGAGMAELEINGNIAKVIDETNLASDDMQKAFSHRVDQ